MIKCGQLVNNNEAYTMYLCYKCMCVRWGIIDDSTECFRDLKCVHYIKLRSNPSLNRMESFLIHIKIILNANTNGNHSEN